MAVAREFYLGPTYVAFDDVDIKDQTEEEARAAWQNTSDIAYQGLLDQHIAKMRRSGAVSSGCSRKIITELHNGAARTEGNEKAPEKQQLPKEQK